MELNFVQHLQERLRASPPARKGGRTREQLKIAAAQVLAEQGYHSFRLRDITDLASSAEGTIYAHFGDRTGVINAVMDEFLDDFLKNHLDRNFARDATVFDSVRASIRHWFAVSRENKGMFRCMLQMGDDQPMFAAQVQRFNNRWSQRLTTSSNDSATPDRGHPPLLLTFAMKSMIRELVRRLIVYPDPMFIEIVREMGGDDDLVADAAALIWVRTLHPDEPLPRHEAAPLADLIAWSRPVDQFTALGIAAE